MPTGTLDASLLTIATNLLLTAAMATALGLVYQRCGASFSNRRAFAKNFHLLAMTIALIITIVKSSLALSLGLVGALSIVRYRAAIKEPEELAYLFITIAIGIGLGAGHQLLTIVAFLLIVGVILVQYFLSGRARVDEGLNNNLSVILPKSGAATVSIDAVLDVVKPHCTRVKVKRFEDTKEQLDVLFLIEHESPDALANLSRDLQAFNEAARVFFLDNPFD